MRRNKPDNRCSTTPTIRRSNETLAAATVVVGVVLCALFAIDALAVEAFRVAGPHQPLSHHSPRHHHGIRKITLSVGASRETVAGGQASLTSAEQARCTTVSEYPLLQACYCIFRLVGRFQDKYNVLVCSVLRDST